MEQAKGDRGKYGLKPFEHVFTEDQAYAPHLDEDGKAYDPVPYGIKHWDKTMVTGVPWYQTSWFLIQGPQGGRKTTLLLNLIKNQLLSGKLPEDHKIFWFSAETGMPVEKLYLYLEGMIASQLILYKYISSGLMEEIKDVYQNILSCDGDEEKYLILSSVVRGWLWDSFDIEIDYYSLVNLLKRDVVVAETDIRPERLIYAMKWPNKTENKLTDLQIVAWEIAKCAISSFNMESYGISAHKDREVRDRRMFPAYDLEVLCNKLDELKDEHAGNCQVFIDHVTAIEAPDGHTQWTSAPVIGPKLKRRIMEYSSPFWVISQESTSQQRSFDQSGKAYGAMGGNYYSMEVDCNIRVSYENNKTPWICGLHAPLKNRIGHFGDSYQPMIANTGVFVGQSVSMEEVNNGY